MNRDSLRIIRTTPNPKDYALHWSTAWNRHVKQRSVMPEPICTDTTGELEFAYADLDRHWRFDWCIPEAKVAVEVDGGKMIVRRTRSGKVVPVGRHIQDDDAWKLNSAASLGWLVFTFTPAMLRKDPVRCVEMVEETVLQRLAGLV